MPLGRRVQIALVDIAQRHDVFARHLTQVARAAAAHPNHRHVQTVARRTRPHDGWKPKHRCRRQRSRGTEELPARTLSNWGHARGLYPTATRYVKGPQIGEWPADSAARR